MRILVTGVGGQLGYDVCKVLLARGIQHQGVDLADFDITQKEAVSRYIGEYAPTAVIHCAAYTAVDRAEEDAARCHAINVEGTRFIAECCKSLGAKMMYISTDYVYPGVGETPYRPEDPTGPAGMYGSTKLEGEQAVQALLESYFIVRISWVFGKNGNNFVKTMLRLGAERDALSIVSDQVGSPTYTADLAPLLCDMIVSEKYGIYNASNEGFCSWAQFAEEIFRQACLAVTVTAVTTEQYGAKAPRPKNSRMSKDGLIEAGFLKLPAWQDALKRYLLEIEG